MIVDQIKHQLELNDGGHLVDLGCGSAALSSRLFSEIESYTGVDFSEYLLGIAREFFFHEEIAEFVEMNVLTFVQTCPKPERFDKALCYGCISYLSRDDVHSLLSALAERFTGVTHVLLGNVPDRAKSSWFFARRDMTDYELDDPQSSIGVWWDPVDLCGAAQAVGFEADVVRMPAEFYGADYRYDVRLRRHAKPS